MSGNSHMNDTSNVKVIHDTTSVSKMLGVQESTLRKYCSLMRKKGYQFNKNTVGHRVFYENDISVLKRIVKLKNSTSFTLEESVERVLSPPGNDTETIDSEVSTADIAYIKLIKEMALFKEEQERFNRKLLNHLQVQEDFIKNSIEERDQKLIMAIKEAEEVKKEVASTEIKQWWKFWK